jgi:hypothetical protein
VWKDKHQIDIPSLTSKTSSYIINSLVFLTMCNTKVVTSLLVICENKIISGIMMLDTPQII